MCKCNFTTADFFFFSGKKKKGKEKRINLQSPLWNRKEKERKEHKIKNAVSFLHLLLRNEKKLLITCFFKTPP